MATKRKSVHKGRLNWRRSVRMWMRECGLTLPEAAPIFGVDRTTLHKWLRKQAPTRPDIAPSLVICEAVGIPIEALLTAAERRAYERGLRSVARLRKVEATAASRS